MMWNLFRKHSRSYPSTDAVPLYLFADGRNSTRSSSKSNVTEFSSYRRKWRDVLPHGWRGSVTVGLILALVVFILNLSITIWAVNKATSNEIDRADGIRTVYSGSCQNSKTIMIVVHLIINIFAALLLAASTNCMQVLSSPQRQEIDKAHASQRWLCVGVPNVKNLGYIAWRRRVIWSILFISSVPLHLLWNSAFVQTVTHNNYIMAAVSEEFETGAPVQYLNENGEDDSDLTAWVNGHGSVIERDWIPALRGGEPIKLNAYDCILAYSSAFNSKYSNLALVMEYQNTTNSLLTAGTFQIDTRGQLQPDWTCGIPGFPGFGTDCSPQKLATTNATYWIPFNTLNGCSAAMDKSNCNLTSSVRHIPPFPPFPAASPAPVPVKYCLAQLADRGCRVGIVTTILDIIVSMNALKVLCILFTLFVFGRMRQDQPLVTTGDAVESFIKDPDAYTQDCCLWSVQAVQTHPEKFWSSSTTPVTYEQKRPRRWYRGAPASSWFALFVPALVGIAIVNYLYVKNDLVSYLRLGFGGASREQLVWFRYPWDLNHGATNSTLLANTPQIVLSYVYCAYNALATRMLAQAEILRFSISSGRSTRRASPTQRRRGFGRIMSHFGASDSFTIRKKGSRRGLRVSDPRPGTHQRSTYYLQLPYRYALSLIFVSALLHWLVSESFFLVRVSVFQTNGFEDPTALISTVGYSAYSIVVAQALMGFILAAIAILAVLRRYDGSDMMPLIAGCSATLAAATQPPNATKINDQPFDNGTEQQRLIWGVTDRVPNESRHADHASNEAAEEGDDGERERRNIPRPGSIEQTEAMLEEGDSYTQIAIPSSTKGHATFSSGEVNRLTEGMSYA